MEVELVGSAGVLCYWHLCGLWLEQISASKVEH